MANEVYPETAYDVPQQEPNGPIWGASGLANTAQCLPGDEIERRNFYIEQCVRTLREAQRIMRDPALMADVRAYVRKERDDLGALLDG